MLPDGIVCNKTRVAVAQRAVGGCIQTRTFVYADLVLQFCGMPRSVQLHRLPLGLVCKSRKPRTPCDRLQSGPPTKTT